MDLLVSHNCINAISDAAHEWLNENVSYEDWQKTGDAHLAILVEPRMRNDIIHAALTDNLCVHSTTGARLSLDGRLGKETQ